MPRHLPHLTITTAAASLALACLVQAQVLPGTTVPRDDQKGRYVSFEIGQVQPLAWIAGEPALWAINQAGNRLVKLDPVTLQRLDEVPIGLGGASVFERPGTDELWVVDSVQGCVTIVSRTSHAITRTVRVGAQPHSLCFSPSGDRAWVTCSGVDRVDVVDTTLYKVVQSIAIPAREPRAIVFAAGRVWVASFLSGNGTAVAGTAADPLDARAIGRPQGPSHVPLPDRDLFAIVPGQLGHDVLDLPATRTHLGTTLFNLHVRPGTTELWIPNTEALNAGHVGEKSFTGGRVVANRITVVDAAGIQPTRVLDIDVIAPAGVRCSQPTGIAFDPAGTRAYVCGYGSDIVAVFNIVPGGGLLWRGHVNLPPRQDYPAGTAPRAAVMTGDGAALYVLNRNDVSVTRIDLATLPTSMPFVIDSPLPAGLGFEATSGEQRLGRHLFTDGRNSQSLTSSCASCHVDGHTDGLAWDLGTFLDPAPTPADQVRFALDAKGPLVTQSTRRMEESAPFHWRGEKKSINDFNDAFITLLKHEENGVAAHIGPDFQYLRHFINRLAWPANPQQNADRSLTSEQAEGADLFQTKPVLGALTCASCHTLPLGTRGEVVAEAAGGTLRSADVPLLRGAGTKEGVAHTIGGEYGTRPELGAGLTHAGVFATFEEAIMRPDHPQIGPQHPGQPHFDLRPTEVQSIAAFLRAFDTGLAPSTAFQVTVDQRTTPGVRADLAYLRGQAEAGHCDVVVLRTPPPGATPSTFARTGMYDPGTQMYLLSDSTAAPVDDRYLLLEAQNGRPVTFVGMPLGSGLSHGLDRDMDGSYDVDEARAGTNPDNSDTDGDRFPDGYELSFGADPLTYDLTFPADTVPPQLVGTVRLVYATTNTLKFEFETSEPCRVHLRLNGGPPVQRVPLDHQVDRQHWVILGDLAPATPQALTPGTAYTIDLEMRDPAGNIHLDSSTVLVTLPATFAAPARISAMQLSIATVGSESSLTSAISLTTGSAPVGAGYAVHTAVYRQPAGGALQLIARDVFAPTDALGIALPVVVLPPTSGPGTCWVVVTGVDAPSGAPPYVMAHDVLRHKTIPY